MHIFLVHPGYVTSKRDGDLHYITFPVLTMLYRVARVHCLNVVTFPDFMRERLKKGYINLYPDPAGNYDINNILQKEYTTCAFYKEGIDREGSLFRCNFDPVTQEALAKNWEGAWCLGQCKLDFQINKRRFGGNNDYRKN